MHRTTELHVMPGDLLAFAWSAPMRDLAAKAGLSDVGLKKLLRAKGVVTPPQGHWNRVAAGRTVPEPPPVPARGPGENGRISLDARFRDLVEDVGTWPVDGPFTTARVPETLDALRASVLANTPPVKLPRLTVDVHRGVRHLLRHEDGDMKGPAARGWPAEPPPVATPSWNRQLRLLNALFLALDRHGAPGAADATEGQLAATVQVGHTAVALALVPVGTVRKRRHAGAQRPASDLHAAATPLRLEMSWPEEGRSWQDEPGLPLEARLREVVADVITAGEAGFRRALREHRDWLARVAAMEEAQQQQRLAAEETARTVRLSEFAAALHEADGIRALVARVRIGRDGTVDGPAVDCWCEWALGRADRLDPVVSGALVRDFELGVGASAQAGLEPGST